jgi:hypothetical protein
MTVVDHVFGNIGVSVVLGPYDDSKIDIVVRSEIIPMGLDAGSALGAGGTPGGLGITIKEATSVDNVEYWPGITIQDPNRRPTIYNTAKGALDTAERLKHKSIGFFTLGLEVSGVPSWEVAEEIVKAIYTHSKGEHGLTHVFIVASSPTQVSSFRYAIDNITVITS